MQENNISRFGFEHCQKCSICNTVCPMMAVNPNYPGPKKAGPDGERYRLKDQAFYDYALKYCLNCKRCEAACPSGVKIADIIASARISNGKPTKPLRDWALSNTDLVGTLAGTVAPVSNFALGTGVAKSVMHGVMGVDKHRTFPKYSAQKFTTWFHRNAEASQAAYKRQVSFFHGCYANYNYPQLGRDFVTVMNACGYGVRLLEKEKCCGVALISNGFAGQAAKQAGLNIASMRKALASGSEAVLTVSSSCTFTMRDEYPHILGVSNDDVRDSLMLAVKFICEKVEAGEIKLAFRRDFNLHAAYHTACHMQKLGWSVYTQRLLRLVPGLKLDVLEQECCGIAGTFGFKKENYAYSQAIGSKLFTNIAACGAQKVITECETCKWQIEMSTGVEVMNPISLLAEVLDIQQTSSLNR